LERFGRQLLAEDGTLRRPDLAARVFNDAQARRDLEAIVHPSVRRGIDAFFAGLPPSTAFAVADIPLLYETDRAGDFDAVVVAACPPDMQVTRVMARDGLTEAAVRQRLAAQMPIGEKARRADFVIDTGGSFGETDAGVTRVLEALRARAER
jgi:dephospho-CoA kinase